MSDIIVTVSFNAGNGDYVTQVVYTLNEILWGNFSFIEPGYFSCEEKNRIELG